jgi:hypothetical protein
LNDDSTQADFRLPIGQVRRSIFWFVTAPGSAKPPSIVQAQLPQALNHEFSADVLSTFDHHLGQNVCSSRLGKFSLAMNAVGIELRCQKFGI